MRRTPFFIALIAGFILLAALGPLPAQPPRDAAPGELPPPAQAAPEKLPLPAASGPKRPAAAEAEDDTTAAAETKQKKKDDKKQEPPPPDGRCDICGGCDCVRKVCASKMTTKEIKKVCWDAKCEDFCVPGRSVWCGKMCRQDDCGCWTHDLWKPTCAEVRTRVVPVRKETKRTVPAVEWKVEERCACCRRRPADRGATPPTDGEKQAAADGANQASSQPRTPR